MTDAPEITKWAPYAVDGGVDAYGQMEEDVFGDYYRCDDVDAALDSLTARVAELEAQLADSSPLREASPH